jgi:cytochrome c553
MNSRISLLLFWPCFVLALVSTSAPARAAYTWIASAPPQEIEARLARLQSDSGAHKAAISAGKRAAFFCANCHGETGVSALEHVPNLAGQNAFYLLAQIDKFGDGRRKDDFMSGLVKVLKPDERFNIAVFYASQPVLPTAASERAQAIAGGKHFARACVGCHGAKGYGTREVARLAGQRNGYLVTALSNYRSGKAGRADSRMTGVAQKLSDAEIAALASFLGTLP